MSDLTPQKAGQEWYAAQKKSTKALVQNVFAGTFMNDRCFEVVVSPHLRALENSGLTAARALHDGRVRCGVCWPLCRFCILFLFTGNHTTILNLSTCPRPQFHRVVDVAEDGGGVDDEDLIGAVDEDSVDDDWNHRTVSQAFVRDLFEQLNWEVVDGHMTYFKATALQSSRLNQELARYCALLWRTLLDDGDVADTAPIASVPPAVLPPQLWTAAVSAVKAMAEM